MLNILPKQPTLTSDVLGYDVRRNAVLIMCYADTLIPQITNVWLTTLQKPNIDLTVGISPLHSNIHITQMYIVWLLAMGLYDIWCN